MSQTLTNSKPYEIHQRLVDTITLSKHSFVVMGKLLSLMKRDDNFTQAVGEGIDTWDAYISQPEIGLSRGEADRLVQIYETFVEKFGYGEDEIAELPVKNIHYLLPIAKRTEDKEQVDNLIGAARDLAQKDFKDYIYEEKHPDQEPTYEYLIMRRTKETGTMRKVHGIDSDQIKAAFNLDDRTQT